MEHGDDEVLAVTTDAGLVRHLLSVTAAVGASAEIEPDVARLRPRWRGPAMVLVGVDLAAAVAGLGLPRRSGVYVVGGSSERDATHAWSARLGAAVVTLPDGAADLAAAVAELATSRTRPSRTVCVVGGVGGAGASTLAAALALTAARAGARSLLVDADPLSGGIDLLLGAEQLEGWRWSRLASARGHLGDLGGQLPQAEGVDVLAMDRPPDADRVLQPEQVRAVLSSAARSHQLTVVDLPRVLGAGTAEALRRADQTVLVVPADVRAVAAARQVIARLRPSCRSLGLVVRLARARGLDPGTVADALELSLLAVVEDDPSVAGGAERGDPPGRSPRSPLARACRRLLGRAELEQRAA